MKLRTNRIQHITVKHGPQHVSGNLEKLIENETYVARKAIRQMSGFEPYLRNVGKHLKTKNLFTINETIFIFVTNYDKTI